MKPNTIADAVRFLTFLNIEYRHRMPREADLTRRTLLRTYSQAAEDAALGLNGKPFIHNKSNGAIRATIDLMISDVEIQIHQKALPAAERSRVDTLTQIKAFFEPITEGVQESLF